MSDVVSLTALIGASGVAGWLGNVVLEMIKGRGNRVSSDREADLKLEQHRDGLTFQLLDAARVEMGVLNEQLERLRPLEGHILHMQEALMHIERMLFVPFDSGNRGQIEREARAFLNRMRRNQDTMGTLANEAQRVDSAIEMVARDKGASQ